ncbi:MAG: hypothetical protein NZZ60_05080 [Bacteroidia bacterium]|nr:hypothetical protein [Bacteroidia bacterium]MCX7652137.1 hypothetical protein [Bacteroidia bacterium]MDW8416914.1 hypothetical protein [Bacteroidia bacterium]
MEIRLLPLRYWMQMAAWAIIVHTLGALAIDYLAWKLGFVYEIMAGQLLLLAGGGWLLIVLLFPLWRMRRFGYLDPIRIILWVLGVSIVSAPVKAIGERLMEPALRSEYEAYPEKRAAALRAYFRAQSESGRVDIPLEQRETIIRQQIDLYQAYRERQKHLGYAIVDRLKILSILGIIYGLILGLLMRGGGISGGYAPAASAKSANNAE